MSHKGAYRTETGFLKCGQDECRKPVELPNLKQHYKANHPRKKVRSLIYRERLPELLSNDYPIRTQEESMSYSL